MSLFLPLTIKIKIFHNKMRKKVEKKKCAASSLCSSLALPILWLKIDFLQKDIDLNIPSETSPFCGTLKEKHIKLNVGDGKFETP